MREPYHYTKLRLITLMFTEFEAFLILGNEQVDDVRSDSHMFKTDSNFWNAMAKPKAIPCQIAKPHTPNTRENSNRVTFFRAAELAAEPAATCTATSAVVTVAIFLLKRLTQQAQLLYLPRWAAWLPEFVVMIVWLSPKERRLFRFLTKTKLNPKREYH